MNEKLQADGRAVEAARPSLLRRFRVMVSLIVLLLLVGALMALQSKVLQVLLVISESMEPTLLVGDRILVDANAWPARFQVVTLDDPEEKGSQLVKRIVGIAGDRIEIRGGILYINGEEQYSRHVTTNRLAWRDVRINVPEDHVFVLGDNRNNSYDSLNFGPVHVDRITGVLTTIVWPMKRMGPVDDFAS